MFLSHRQNSNSCKEISRNNLNQISSVNKLTHIYIYTYISVYIYLEPEHLSCQHITLHLKEGRNL